MTAMENKIQMGVLYHERREQNKNDRRQYFPEDHPVCHPAVSRKSVSAVVQHGRFPDRGKLSWQQRAGGSQLVGQSDFSDGRLHQWYRDGCRCRHREVLRSEKQGRSAEGDSHDRGLWSCGGTCPDCDRYVSGTENPGADGNTVRCASAVSRVFPYVFRRIAWLCHV